VRDDRAGASVRYTLDRKRRPRSRETKARASQRYLVTITETGRALHQHQTRADQNSETYEGFRVGSTSGQVLAE
jgi:hypothetical protein